ALHLFVEYLFWLLVGCLWRVLQRKNRVLQYRAVRCRTIHRPQVRHITLQCDHCFLLLTGLGLSGTGLAGGVGRGGLRLLPTLLRLLQLLVQLLDLPLLRACASSLEPVGLRFVPKRRPKVPPAPGPRETGAWLTS